MGDDRAYWVGFSLVQGIGPIRLQRLLDHFGKIQSAWIAPRNALKEAGIPRNAIDNLIRLRTETDPREELDRLEALGVRLLTWADPRYPSWLREINDPPIVLYLRGDLVSEEVRLAMVGTRRPSSYGIEVAQELARALAEAGVCIVSGLARGIDGAAHKAALAASGRTVAVLGSGIDHIYPPEHRKLAAEIEAAGAVITEYPLGTRPEAGNFPPRNRIISGLSRAVVVVEAGEGSGALITADFAADQGRDVYAVPGGIYRRTSQGTNRLIQQGAFPVLGAKDLLEGLNLVSVAHKRARSVTLLEDPRERSLVEMLSSDPVHIDDLGLNSGLSAAEITATLSLLELRGQVKRVGGMHYVRIREPGLMYKVD